MRLSSHQNGHSLSRIVGSSARTERLREAIDRCAPHDSTVLVSGPTGTGKELVARSIHQASPRSGATFIPVDCTAVSGTLFGSQLFGHRKGSFTGADYDAAGYFRAAHHGTIFLDEIGELERDLQSKLLRVLQERTVVPIGSYDPVPIDVRVICATHRDLKREVAEGRFREDLYYRLNVVQVETPPLRDHAEDIPALVEHFLDQLATRVFSPRKRFSPGALELLALFDWPGNVRQLRHFVEQAVVACDEDLITLPVAQQLLEQARMPAAPCRPLLPGEDFCCDACRSKRLAEAEHSPSGEEVRKELGETAAPAQWATLADLERQHLLSTLEHTFYNQSAAARLLGITRSMLIRKMQLYGLSVRAVHAPNPAATRPRTKLPR